MRVLIDALATTGGGGATYLRGLLPALGKADPQTEYVVLRAPWQDFWDFELPDNAHLLNVPLPKERSVLGRVLWEQFAMPVLARENDIDVLYCPGDIASLLAPCPVVLAIRNSNPYLGGSLGRGWRYYVNRKIALRTLTWASARKAARVIFVSNFSRSVVCRQLRIPIQKTEVIYHGLSPIFRSCSDVPLRMLEIPHPYLLSVSNILAHKNYPFLVRVFAQMTRDADFQHHLIIAGSQVFQKDVKEMERIADEAGIAERVHLLGHVPHDDLSALYRHADLFVLPSLLETFGHPLVEAMASGVPIVASNSTCIPEICGDAALYFDPADVNQAVEQISRALTDRSLRQCLVAKGLRRATEFSWEQTARKTLNVLKAATD